MHMASFGILWELVGATVLGLENVIELGVEVVADLVCTREMLERELFLAF